MDDGGWLSVDNENHFDIATGVPLYGVSRSRGGRRDDVRSALSSASGRKFNVQRRYNNNNNKKSTITPINTSTSQA